MIPLGVMLVNHKIQIFLIFLEVYLKDTFSYSLGGTTASGQDAPRSLPSPARILCFPCQLEVSARGRGYRFGLLRRRGDTT